MRAVVACGQCDERTTVTGRTEAEVREAWLAWSKEHKPKCPAGWTPGSRG